MEEEIDLFEDRSLVEWHRDQRQEAVVFERILRQGCSYPHKDHGHILLLVDLDCVSEVNIGS